MTPAELRAAVLAARDVKIEPVPTPEWPEVDGAIYVRSMSAAQRDVYLSSLRIVGTPVVGQAPTVKVDATSASVKLAALTMCDEKGELLFTMEDVTQLGEKSAIAMERVRDVAADINGMSDKARTVTKNASPSVTT